MPLRGTTADRSIATFVATAAVCAVSALGTALGVMGCSSNADAPVREETASASQGIAGGYNDDDDDVANVVVSLNGQSCTGTLITPTVILTAQHCINGDNTGKRSPRSHNPFGIAKAMRLDTHDLVGIRSAGDECVSRIRRSLKADDGRDTPI
jgi:hypothetical protein